MRHHTFLMIAGGLCAASLPAQTPTGPAPTGFDVLVNSPSSVRATWTRGTSITAYMVARYRSSNLTTPERQSAWLSATTTSWDDPGLVGGTTYVYRLAAKYSNNTIGVAEKTVPLPVVADAPAPVITGQQAAQSIGAGHVFRSSPQRNFRERAASARGEQHNSIDHPSADSDVGAQSLRRKHFLWSDNTLTAAAKYYYSVIGDLSDGRKGTSAWSAFTPVLGVLRV